MHPKISKLQNSLANKWAHLEAEEARPADRAWFAAYVALMFETDQRYRALYVELLDGDESSGIADLAKQLRAADTNHQERLKAWLADRSWPRISEFGSETCTHAWMIALHADNDCEFQEQVLAEMKRLLGGDEVAAVHFAALSDRIALNRGRPQRYGMFYRVDDGQEIPYPVEDAEHLEQRRSELGLGAERFRR